MTILKELPDGYIPIKVEIYNEENLIKLAKEKILADEKEKAEHIMIVDLLRNDLNRVAKNVKVNNFRYVEQIKAWRANALQGFSHSKPQSLKDKRQQQADRKQIKQLTRELARKEKALAETAALLVLRKKLEAFWEEHEDD